jgi:hypothetical protein
MDELDEVDDAVPTGDAVEALKTFIVSVPPLLVESVEDPYEAQRKKIENLRKQKKREDARQQRELQRLQERVEEEEWRVEVARREEQGVQRKLDRQRERRRQQKLSENPVNKPNWLVRREREQRADDVVRVVTSAGAGVGAVMVTAAGTAVGPMVVAAGIASAATYFGTGLLFGTGRRR